MPTLALFSSSFWFFLLFPEYRPISLSRIFVKVHYHIHGSKALEKLYNNIFILKIKEILKNEIRARNAEFGREELNRFMFAEYRPISLSRNFIKARTYIHGSKALEKLYNNIFSLKINEILKNVISPRRTEFRRQDLLGLGVPTELAEPKPYQHPDSCTWLERP